LIFRRIVQGLHHVHAAGYFHHDMKPENILVTTTGHLSYRNLSPLAPPDAPPPVSKTSTSKQAFKDTLHSASGPRAPAKRKRDRLLPFTPRTGQQRQIVLRHQAKTTRRTTLNLSKERI
jgi:serine/threonine protein kinase